MSEIFRTLPLIAVYRQDHHRAVDEVDEEGAIARSSADAPEIDGQVYIENGQRLNVGDFVEVTVTDSDEHDLWAETV